MSEPDLGVNTDVLTPEVTLESVAERLDVIGNQLNWLIDNLQSLFAFVNQMSQNGGGIRSMLSMLKKGTPEMTVPNTIAKENNDE